MRLSLFGDGQRLAMFLTQPLCKSRVAIVGRLDVCIPSVRLDSAAGAYGASISTSSAGDDKVCHDCT